MNNLIDTHCHLDLFENIQQNVIQEDNTGIKTITVTNAPSFYKPNVNLFVNSNNIRVALGIHPQLIEQGEKEFLEFEKLAHESRYFGEIGLDGSPDMRHNVSLQRLLFVKILQIATSINNKILTIHSRNAATETIDLLLKYIPRSNCKVILHWYSGSLMDLKMAVANNFFFSVNHKMIETIKGKEITKAIPQQLLLTETDAPFTFTSGINSRLKSLNRTVAGLAIQKGVQEERMRQTIYENFKTLLT